MLRLYIYIIIFIHCILKFVWLICNVALVYTAKWFRYTYIFIYIYMGVCIYMCTWTYIYTYTCLYIYIHTRKYVYMNLGLLLWLRWWRICLQCRKPRFDSWVGKIPWKREWQPTLVFLPGEPHGQRSLAGYSPWGRSESDTAEATEHSCIYVNLGKLQEIMRDRGSWRVLQAVGFQSVRYDWSDLASMHTCMYVCVCVYIHTHIYLPFQILFPVKLLQNIKESIHAIQ